MRTEQKCLTLCSGLQWALKAQQEGYQKNLLEEEWCFVRTNCLKTYGGLGITSNIFCKK